MVSSDVEWFGRWNARMNHVDTDRAIDGESESALASTWRYLLSITHVLIV